MLGEVAGVAQCHEVPQRVRPAVGDADAVVDAEVLRRVAADAAVPVALQHAAADGRALARAGRTESGGRERASGSTSCPV